LDDIDPRFILIVTTNKSEKSSYLHIAKIKSKHHKPNDGLIAEEHDEERQK
jgi:hypothetical protein